MQQLGEQSFVSDTSSFDLMLLVSTAPTELVMFALAAFMYLVVIRGATTPVAEPKVKQLPLYSSPETTQAEMRLAELEAEKTARHEAEARIAELRAEKMRSEAAGKEQFEAGRAAERAVQAKVIQGLEARVAELHVENIAARVANEWLEVDMTAEQAVHAKEAESLRVRIMEIESPKNADRQADKDLFEAERTAERTLHAQAECMEKNSEVQRLRKRCQDLEAEHECCRAAAEHAAVELEACVAERETDVELLKNTIEENARLQVELNKRDEFIAQLLQDVEQKQALIKRQEETIKGLNTEYWSVV
eukprot:gnl/TRDRNA2_/TRDRNA2_180499_c0_seq1.p1 gnl/TRDRNA2_/TRDRNA2_180499_c0~~gnl/TRDRNA2_/TRDRNA2_180499_c0_seq1.p1  ORF type:complete len:306 (-),score=95.80 gnl/TRDRNA2_/TRDRNA2_180499_c0_seq1:143-1060(-)